jgi:phosphoserine aminotransferase
MARVFNFSAGPSVLPEEVLQEAAADMLDYKGTGMSVMEMSHRSKAFTEIIENAEAAVRKNMNVPEGYHVLFIQGGASLQFIMQAQNFLTVNKKADFINTGAWSKKAITEAKKFGEVRVVASSEDKTFTYIPEIPAFDPEADFVHITYNNTIYGTQFHEIPDTKGIPLFADISSGVLSKPLDISKFDLLYGGAQKNLGPAGMALVIVKDSLLERIPEGLPTYLDYRTHVKNKSLFNTPPCWAIYIFGLVQEWILKQGGPEKLFKANEEKAALLYNYLDESPFFTGTVVKKDRSLMNVPFLSPSEELNAKFIAEATKAGLENLKGHRTVGGMRASIYNAMPLEGVQKLVTFMKDFEKNNQ